MNRTHLDQQHHPYTWGKIYELIPHTKKLEKIRGDFSLELPKNSLFEKICRFSFFGLTTILHTIGDWTHPPTNPNPDFGALKQAP
jgi:hypothetical protein